MFVFNFSDKYLILRQITIICRNYLGHNWYPLICCTVLLAFVGPIQDWKLLTTLINWRQVVCKTNTTDDSPKNFKDRFVNLFALNYNIVCLCGSRKKPNFLLFELCYAIGIFGPIPVHVVYVPHGLILYAWLKAGNYFDCILILS